MSDLESGYRGASRTTENVVIGFSLGCGCLSVLILFGIMVGFFAAISIAELIMAAKYHDEMTCVSPVISIYTWLIVDGIVGLVCAFIITVALGIGDFDASTIGTCVITNYFGSAFHLVWLIIGSVAFWRDCSTMGPKPINDFMYAVLIIGYISIYFQANAKNNKDN